MWGFLYTCNLTNVLDHSSKLALQNSKQNNSFKGLEEKIEDVNQRWDNIMTKRKSTKGQTRIYKTFQRKLKIKQHKSHWKL
jgi:predicted nuclease with TOPRIM domain